MTDNEPDTITFELPLSANANDKNGITVDALFTALDHAKAYHDHDEFSWYVNAYDNLENHLKGQGKEQLD